MSPSTSSPSIPSETDNAKVELKGDGSFDRKASSFRSNIEKGGRFEPAKDRYHLYVSYSCPWATRTLVMRKLKGLEDIISLTAVSPRMQKEGWAFASVDDFPGAEIDPLYGSKHIQDLYFKADPQYSGRFTVPVLWDKTLNTIVNNESSEIIRIFNTAFNELLPKDKAALDFYPQELKKDIDELNDFVYTKINNGVYRAGFASTQEAYEEAVKGVFEGLDKVESILKDKEYLVSGKLTEADIRLWVSIIRFDPAYHGHFKCNLRTIRHGYPAINKWLKNLYWNNEAFKTSTNFKHIKTGYYWSQAFINPTRVVPIGPDYDIEPL